MKAILSSFIFFLLVSTTSAQNKDAILGTWQSATGEARIQVYKRGDKYVGKIAWLKEPNKDGKPKVDSNNPDKALAFKPILGMEMLKDFKYTDSNEWSGGSIYDPKSGKTYSCKMSLASPDKLNIRGYIGISLLGRTEVWTRVKN